ncbi:hypothetical protein, partial [Saccharopolyspora thermophila]|uniref:hypothetical protein n=1 Tax=Saccharopolyspora thermophila TaxID=89367 RepID=UPI0031F9674B
MAAQGAAAYDSTGWGGDRYGPVFQGIDSAGREITFDLNEVRLRYGWEPKGSARPAHFLMLSEGSESAQRVHKWAGNIRRQLRVVRTLPGDTTEQALLRSRNRKRGEIDAPFEVPLVVAVHSVGDRVVLPVDRGDGVENVQVTRDTAAKCIGGLVQGYDSVFLLVPESEQADFAVNLAQKIVEQRDNLVVYTSAGTTHVTPDGKLVVMGNAGLVTVKRQLFLDFLSATRVEPLR